MVCCFLLPGCCLEGYYVERRNHPPPRVMREGFYGIAEFRTGTSCLPFFLCRLSLRQLYLYYTPLLGLFNEDMRSFWKTDVTIFVRGGSLPTFCEGVEMRKTDWESRTENPHGKAPSASTPTFERATFYTHNPPGKNTKQRIIIGTKWKTDFILPKYCLHSRLQQLAVREGLLNQIVNTRCL